MRCGTCTVSDRKDTKLLKAIHNLVVVVRHHAVDYFSPQMYRTFTPQNTQTHPRCPDTPRRSRRLRYGSDNCHRRRR